MTGKRIKELRKQAGLTQAELGNRLGVIKQTVSSWENEISSPSGETLTAMSKLFEVSVDYILCGTNQNNSIHNDVPANCSSRFSDKFLRDIFVQRLSKALAQRQMSSAELSLNSDIQLDKCQAYITGDQAPTLEDLSSISDVLHVSTDYLLGKINTKEDGALASFKTLGEDNQDIIVGDMKRYIKEERRAVTVAEEAAEKKVVGK